MTLEHTLRQLLADAAPRLRTAVKDALVVALLDDQRSVLFDLVRKAYELGYREALANQPAPPDKPSIKTDDDDLEPEDADDGVPSVPPDPDDVEDDNPDAGDRPPERTRDVDWNALGPTDGAVHEPSKSAVRRETAPLRVRSSLTIGSLRTRIFRAFELERFDIDVVICRKGDKNRRQLKSSVRLAKYELEDEGRLS